MACAFFSLGRLSRGERKSSGMLLDREEINHQNKGWWKDSVSQNLPPKEGIIFWKIPPSSSSFVSIPISLSMWLNHQISYWSCLTLAHSLRKSLPAADSHLKAHHFWTPTMHLTHDPDQIDGSGHSSKLFNTALSPGQRGWEINAEWGKWGKHRWECWRTLRGWHLLCEMFFN